MAVVEKKGIMRAFLARRDRDGRASRRLQQAREWVDGHSSTKMVYWEVCFSYSALNQYGDVCEEQPHRGSFVHSTLLSFVRGLD